MHFPRERDPCEWCNSMSLKAQACDDNLGAASPTNIQEGNGDATGMVGRAMDNSMTVVVAVFKFQVLN